MITIRSWLWASHARRIKTGFVIKVMEGTPSTTIVLLMYSQIKDGIANVSNCLLLRAVPWANLYVVDQLPKLQTIRRPH